MLPSTPNPSRNPSVDQVASVRRRIPLQPEDSVRRDRHRAARSTRTRQRQAQRQGAPPALPAPPLHRPERRCRRQSYRQRRVRRLHEALTPGGAAANPARKGHPCFCVPHHASFQYLRRTPIRVVLPLALTCPSRRKFEKVASLPTKLPEWETPASSSCSVFICNVFRCFWSPMMLVRMCIDDEHIAPRAHYAAQFSQCSARTHHVMHEHMTHRDINGTARQGELLGHPFLEENMLVPGMGHLLPGPC